MTTAAQTWTETTVEVANRKMRLLQGGSGEPAVVLHHSTGNPGWLPFHEALAQRFAVTVPDMPGYGQSERPEWARDPRDLAILTDRMLAQVAPENVTLIGTGFGGFVAAELAAMHQERLRSLVLVGAAGLQPEEGEILDQLFLDFHEYVAAGFRDEARFHEAFGEEIDKPLRELWDYSREMTARVSWRPYMFDRRLAPHLGEVKTPALLVWGSEDRVVPVNCGELYAKALANAKLEIVQGAGHLVEYEEPEGLAGMIATHAGVA